MYWFLDQNGKVLYVGKAKNLKNRIQSYARVNGLRRKTKLLVTTATEIKWQVLQSELEAILIEAELIRTHLPEYNILLKDDKTPLYINITKDAYPLVKMVRKKDVDTGSVSGTILGPFTSSYKVKEVLKLVRPIFKWCAKPNTSKPCFFYHIDMCSGACINTISKEEYQNSIQDLTEFLRGKKKSVIVKMTQKMKDFAQEHKFEQAAIIRDKIRLISQVTSHQYTLKPDLVLPQLRETNRADALIQLRTILSQHLKLPRTITINRIEGYDVSNNQGVSAGVAMVTFLAGKPSSEHYRVFTIKTLNTPNDYGMLQEALIRRQNHPEWGLPDLLVIDGGKGQLRAALRVWKLPCPVISIAKKPDRIIIPKVETALDKTTPDKKSIQYTILKLEETHPVLQLMQHVRDEAHRFSKKHHHRLHAKTILPKYATI